MRFEPLEERRLLAYTVSTLIDESDGNYSAGDLSLREAIQLANSAPGADEITFAPELTAGGPNAITLEQGELLITEALSIQGPGQALLGIYANEESRIFHFSTTTGDLSISGLRLLQGQVNESLYGPQIDQGSGAAVRSLTSGLVTITGCHVAENGTLGASNRGGAISTWGDLAIVDSTIAANYTMGQDAHGGAIYSRGKVTLTNSEVSGNRVEGNAWGGAIYAEELSATGSKIRDNRLLGYGYGGGLFVGQDLDLTDSLVSGNRIESNILGSGGGIFAGQATVTRSEISNNGTISAEGRGGGIRAATLRLVESIVSGNTTTGDRAYGGGIYTSDLYAYSSIIENNSTAGESAHGGGVSAGEVLLSGSTLSGNSTSGDAAHGGGVRTGTAVVVNSTVSGNTTSGAGSHGGGLAATNAYVLYSTVSKNNAAAANANGGGLFIDRFHLPPTTETESGIYHSIVAENLAGGVAPDVWFGFPTPDMKHSLVGDNAGSPFAEAQTADANGNLIGGAGGAGVIDPVLGPLVYNGGPILTGNRGIRTHALFAGSPALDAGAEMPEMFDPGEFDQRGAGYARLVGPRLDIGAYERQATVYVVDTVADEDDGDYSAGDFSLREAIALANGDAGADTIEFSPTLWALGPATLVLSLGELAITDSVTINGPGAALLTIDASGNDPTPDQHNGDGSRVFNIGDGINNTSPGSLFNAALVGMTITGGDSAGLRGGGIHSRENLTLHECIITGNAIRNAVGGGGSAGWGGGIQSLYGSLTISDSTIANNFATVHGGGVDFNTSQRAGSKLTITNSLFLDNEALGEGGGIQIVGPAIVEETRFEGNQAQFGGGVHVRRSYSGVVEIVRSEMVGNEAVYGGGFTLSEYGGRITTRIVDSLVSGNTAVGGGGGISTRGVQSSPSVTPPALEVIGTTITDNSAEDGGGLWLGQNLNSASRVSVVIQDSTITGNDAASDGGGLYAQLQWMSLVGSTIEMNTAGQRGGGLFLESPATLEDNRIEENTATNGGGMFIVARRDMSVTIRGSEIDENTARSGGGIGIGTSSFPPIGGVGMLTIENSSISNNSSQGIYGSATNPLGPLPNVTITGSSIEENVSTGVDTRGGTLTVSDSTVLGNGTGAGNVGLFGGGIAAAGALTVTRTNVVGNKSVERGGGIFGSGTVTIIDSRVMDNKASQQGGGVHSVGVLNITRSVIAWNETDGIASAHGGGVFGLNIVNIVQSTVENNRTLSNSSMGGGVFSTGTLTVTESLIAGNSTSGTAALGGGLAGGTVIVRSSTVSGNSTSGFGAHGGGIRGTAVRSYYSTIASNSATNANAKGGGIYTNTLSPLRHTIVAGNTAGSSNPDLRFTGTPGIFNSLIGNLAGTTLVEAQVPNASGSLIGSATGGGVIDPLLEPLADNCGPTWTHALAAGSRARDAGAVGVNQLTDQRGTPFVRKFGTRVDIGAYEEQSLSLVVDTLVDEVDGNFAAGDLSLREAIELANANRGADAISFKASLTAAGPAKILLTQGYLHVQDAVTIHGPGAELLTIDAAGSDPTPNSTLDDGIDENDGDGTIAFVVGDTHYADRLAVEIAGMTLTGGDATSAGAISSSENLRLVDVAIVDNSAQQGGGVYQSGGILTVIDSVISHNNTRKHGGGIFVFGGSLAVAGSVISNNTTRDDFGMGGGIAVENSNVTSDPDDFVRIERSVISQNSARGTFAPGGISISGGGNFGNPIDVLISGSTISENTASGNVAGIYLYGASATIEDSTFSSNRYVPRAGVGGVLELPGGIYLIYGNLTLDQSTVVDNLGRRPPFSNPLGSGVHVESGGTLYLDHSIVARNGWTAGLGNPVDVVVEFGTAAASSSLIGAAAGVADEGGSLIGTSAEPIDPMLGPLRYNGGPVFVDGTRMLTHAPLPGSPVIDAGDPAAVAGVNGVPEFDQRGGPWSRVVNGDDVPEARIDMGAVEWQVNPLGGDYNFDGVVDAADYSVWRDTVGSANDLRADGSSATIPGAPDGIVDAHDYAWWKANFGNVLELGAASTEQGVRNAEAGVQNGGGALADELRLAGVGEDRGDTLGNLAPLAHELTLQALPARRSSPSFANLRSDRSAGIDAAMAAWVKSQRTWSHADSSDSKTAIDSSDSDRQCCDCEMLDLAFAGVQSGW